MENPIYLANNLKDLMHYHLAKHVLAEEIEITPAYIEYYEGEEELKEGEQ